MCVPLVGVLSACEIVAGIDEIRLTGSSDAKDGLDSGVDATLGVGDAGGSESTVTGGDGGSADTTDDATAQDADGDANASDETNHTDAPSDASNDVAPSVDSAPADAGDAILGPDGGPVALAKIDDMEGINPSPGWLDGVGTGTWFTYDDGADGGVLVPPPGATADKIISAIVPTHVTYQGTVSAKAARMTSNSGFTRSFGCGIGFNLNARGGVQGPFDASAYRGVVFWARASTDAGAIVARFQVLDVHTAGAGSGGTCDGGVCQGPYGIDLGKIPDAPPLSSDWHRYVVFFSEFTRPDWASVSPPPPPFAIAQMVSVQVQLGKGVAADLWIDDIYFILK